jgi:hypothetical protein
MKMTQLTALMILISFAAQGVAFAQGASKGRIVVFADKKEGIFKTDKSIRPGSNENLEDLKSVGSLGIHACFIGTPQDVKPILNTMITNENKFSKADETLKLSAFVTKDGSQSINLEISSDVQKSVYLKLKIDPC